MNKSKLKIRFDQDIRQRGIWKYHRYLKEVPEKFRLSLGEGSTAEDYINDLDVTFKREDQNPTGSLKDRGTAFLISKYYSEGKTDFVISSSGNAAISAANVCRQAGLNLTIFISPNIESGKLKIIKSFNFEIKITPSPLSQSARFAFENGFVHLRPSTDIYGSEGYRTISFELLAGDTNFDDIFIPVSSGSCFIGVFEGFSKFGFLPRFHLCQSSVINPVARIFDIDFIKEDNSLAKAIVAKVVPQKEKIIDIVKKSGGSGWVIDNNRISEAQKILEKNGIITSNEGVLAFAAVIKAGEKHQKLGKTVCLLTGK